MTGYSAPGSCFRVRKETELAPSEPDLERLVFIQTDEAASLLMEMEFFSQS